MEYTKEEVQAFLESKSSDNKVLKRSLERRGYTVSVKKSIFTLDREMKVEGIEAILGFKPSRPSTTITLIKTLLTTNNACFEGTYGELSDLIKQETGQEIDENSIGIVYRELVKKEWAMSTTDARSRGFKEFRKAGKTLTEDDKAEFFDRVNEIRNGLVSFGIAPDEASSMAYSQATKEQGNVNSVPFKLLQFKPEHVEWFKQQ